MACRTIDLNFRISVYRLCENTDVLQTANFSMALGAMFVIEKAVSVGICGPDSVLTDTS